jgi:sortase A
MKRSAGQQSGTTGTHLFGRFSDGMGFLFDALRARAAARRLLTGASVLLAIVGIGLLAYPFATNVYQGRLQTKLAIEFKKAETAKAYKAGTTQIGDPITRISIEAIGLKPTIVVEGTGTSALRAGAGHYPNTPLPGEAGNVALAGHRTTYGKPFADIDRLKAGDEIVLETPIGRHVYKVSRDPFVVPNTDWTVISQSPEHTLTLTSCHPKGSAKQRIVVKATMVPEAPATTSA